MHTIKTKIKIVGTLGPRSSDPEMIGKMLEQGLTVARINMSHGDHTTHSQVIKNARQAAKTAGRPLAIMQDLSGPKIRLGEFTTEEVMLEVGKSITLTTKALPKGTLDLVHVNYSKLPQEVKAGMNIYLNDGKQKLLVTKVTSTDIHTTILSGGTIKGRRGVNVPDADLTISSLTAKDKKDVQFGTAHNVDFVTLSFVRTAKDIRDLRKLLPPQKKVAIVAKIETKAAIEHLDEIVDEADVVMVARGDLAIEMPLEQVPLLQKKIIRTANLKGKPVITATQMLDSMRISTVPTRAEVADIATAILDGSDAIMLSDETTIGNHPDRVIEVMAQVAREIENDPFFVSQQNLWNFEPKTICDGVSRSVARNIAPSKAKVIVALSESGDTGRMVARYRPQVPILVLTPNRETFNKMLIVYGCQPVMVKKINSLAEAQKTAKNTIKEYELAATNDVYILAAGIPFGQTGTTNMLLVDKV